MEHTENRKNLKYRLLFFLTVAVFFALLLSLIASQMRTKTPVSRPLSEVRAAVFSDTLPSGTKEGSDLNLKANFGLLSTDYADTLYFAPESFMSVDEVLVVKLNQASDGEAVQKAVYERIEREQVIFENYGTDQYDLLKNAEVYRNDLYVYYVCGADDTSSVMRFLRQETER